MLCAATVKKGFVCFFVLALYYVSVTTADDIWAGTDAHVFIQIFGENGNTSAVELTKSANLFERGA